MANPWKERAYALNRALAQETQKARDMEAVASALVALPPGQLKKVLTDEVKAVLKKYGYKEE
ncbi:MAG: hypothetical protein IJ461_05865 [Clostridia bacterium]|nr:hypothetical protein [Clostridia bacterium]